MARSLFPDEAALWARVMASVRPLRVVAPAAKSRPTAARAELVEALPFASAVAQKKDSPFRLPAGGSRSGQASTSSGRTEVEEGRTIVSTRARAKTTPESQPPRTPANTLDGGWDKRLARGLVSPDVTVDLHGHSLHSAHDLLDAALAGAIGRGDRLVLLVTGRPPRPESERPHARGAIRAAVGDWLAGSRHASHIVAVRGAHPRHGGAGALYLVLRRARAAKS